MSKPEEKQVVCELKDGGHVEGTLVNIDKVNLKIFLSKVKKASKEDPQKYETYETLEINKDEIKELKLIQYEAKEAPKEETSNLNAIPENKIPTEYQQQQQNKSKSYNKEESFFDNLDGMTHQEARQESKNYNDKNKDTFQVTDDNQGGNYHKNYRGNNRGRGGYRGRGNNRGRGGYNNNNYYNNNNNYQSGGGYNRRGRGRGNRGGNGYGNNNYHKRGNYRGGNQNAQHNANVQGNNMMQNVAKLQAYQPEGGIQPGMEKSIYDN